MSRAQKKDKDIIQAATKLFTELGLDRVSVDDIARAANVSKPTIYSRYKTKEKLYVTILIAECENQIERIFSHRKVGQSLSDFIFEKVYEYLMFIVDDKQTNLIKNAIFYSTKFSEISDAFMKHGPMKGRQKLAEAIDVEIVKGELRQIDAFQAADFILSRSKGLAFFSALLASKQIDIDEQVKKEASLITYEFLALYSSTDSLQCAPSNGNNPKH